MSQIFDALQKSEVERAGPEVAAGEPTEILRRLERSAVSKWDSSANGTAEETLRIEELAARRAQAGAAEWDTAEKAMPDPFSSAKHEDRTSVLNQFQTLPLSLSPESRIVSITDKECPASEAFRLLSVRLRDLGRTRLLKRILITSTTPQEGKTTVATNLAITLARSAQQKVLLIEGDIRRPRISQMFGLQNKPGICEWLNDERISGSCIYRLADTGLWLMPAGSVPGNPLEVLQSAKLNLLMAQLAKWFDSIIIDSAPILPLADTSVWMRVADGVVLVTRQGTTEKKQLQQGLEAIEPEKLIGALLNCSKTPTRGHYYY